jgi:hypothetical protein
MNPFIYAPPPPPPPAAPAPPPPLEQGRQGFGGNANNRRGGGHPRGRGGFRGGHRGASHGHHTSSFNAPASANATPIGQPQNPSYSHGLPNYPQWQQPGVTQPQAYHQPQAGVMTYPPSYYPQTNAQNTYPPPTQQPPNPYYGYGGAQSPTQYSLPTVQPPPVNPPIHVGYNQASFMGNATGSYHGPPAPRNDFNNRKRSFSTQNSNNAAETKPEKKPKVATAPAVPAFGADIAGANLALPARPNWLSTKGKSKGKNKNKKNNSLGLTPSSDAHEEPEEDVDEEAEFAKRAGDTVVLYVTIRFLKLTL